MTLLGQHHRVIRHRLYRPRRWPRRYLLAGVVALIAGATTAAIASRQTPAPPTPTLTLTTNVVAIGGSYFATARGFDAGEPVLFSWTGWTVGEMGTWPAPGGSLTRGPITVLDPPGRYLLVATGRWTDRVALAELEVVPAVGDR